MSIGTNMTAEDCSEDRLFEHAAEWLLRLHADTDGALCAQVEQWRAEDPAHDVAFRKVEAAWGAVGEHATAPEIVMARRDALERAVKAARWRWGSGFGLRRYAAAAAVIFVLLAAGPVYYFLSMGLGEDIQRYETAVGETRVLTLADNSRISLDAETRVLVHYSPEVRLIEMLAGQAYFDVAKDTMRPFRVKVGGHTVVALGTAFNVELLGDQVLVTLIEGRVAVNGMAETTHLNESETGRDYAPSTPAPEVRELAPGQQLVVQRDGMAVLRQNVDLDRATSWRRGRLIFEDEPLAVAVARMNRYSNLKIIVRDSGIENIGISGVFNAGDTEAFVEALEAYFPIRVMRGGNSAIWLYSPG